MIRAASSLSENGDHLHFRRPLTDLDRVKGYERGAVDYISVPVNAGTPPREVSVFVDLHRTGRQLEQPEPRTGISVRERTLELQQSETQFRTLANSIPQLAWMADPDGSILWYSDRWYEYTGLSKEETNGSTLEIPRRSRKQERRP